MRTPVSLRDVVRRLARQGLSLAGAFVVSLFILAGWSSGALAQFACNETLYLEQRRTGWTTNVLYRINPNTNPFVYTAYAGRPSWNYNGIAFHPSTGELFGLYFNRQVRLRADGTIVDLGPVAGLSNTTWYVSGEIGTNGRFYTTNGTYLYHFDPRAATPTATPIRLSRAVDVADLAWYGGYLWSVENNTRFIRIHPGTGAVTDIGWTGGIGGVGAMFGASNGVFGNRNTGGFYKFNTATGVATLISSSPATESNDGAHCVTAALNFETNLAITKTDGVATYSPGKPVTYTIRVSNAGPFGVQDAVVSDPLPTGITSASWTCGAPTGGARCDRASGTGAINTTVDLPPGATLTFRLTLNVPATRTGNLTNTARITAPAGFPDQNTANNVATDTDTMLPGTATVTKTLIAESITRNNVAQPSERLTYRITIRHANGGPITNFNFNENVPAYATLTGVRGATGYTTPVAGARAVALTVASIPVGGTAIVDVDLTMAPSFPDSLTSVTNRVSGGDVPATCTTACTVTVPTPANAPINAATLSCSSDGTLLNTGRTVSGGNDFYWAYAATTTNVTGAPPAGLDYDLAPIVTTRPGGWTGPTSSSNWIAHNSSGAHTGNLDIFYRYQFYLDANTDPASLDVQMEFFSDNAVYQVWVNGVAQNIRSNFTDPYTYGGFLAGNQASGSMEGEWEAGLNTIIVHVKSAAPNQGFMARFASTALCKPTLTLVKNLINDNGGTGTETDFLLRAEGPTTTIEGLTGEPPVTNVSVPAGSYTLSEAPATEESDISGYDTSYSCAINAGTPAAGETVTLENGQNAVCTITNDDAPARLTLTKVVVNDDGGTALPTDFLLAADGPTPVVGGVTGSPEVTNVEVAPGTYSLSETMADGSAVAGYAASYSCAVDGGTPVEGETISLEPGDNAVCTITNDDTGATLTLVKEVTFDNGGTAEPADFVLTATGPETISGPAGSAAVTQASVTPGTYTLSEENLPGYTAGNYRCSINGAEEVEGNTVTLAFGDQAVCTILNDDQPASLTLVKNVVNDNGGTAQPADFTLVAEGVSGTRIEGASGDPAVTNVSVPADTYTLSETALAGYTASEYSCVVGGGAPVTGNTVALGVGQQAVCTVTNDDQPATLTLRKSLINNNGGIATPSDFILTATGASTISGATGDPAVTAASVSAGTYALSETGPAGYTAGAYRCAIDNGAPVSGNTLTLAPGQAAVCEIANDDIPPSVRITKALVGETGSADLEPEIGEQLTYQVTLTNTGGTYSNYPLEDVLDPNVAFVSASDGGSYVAADHEVQWTLTVPAAGDGTTPGTLSVTVVVEVVGPLDPGEKVVNIAQRPIDPPTDCTVQPTPPNCVIIPPPAYITGTKQLISESFSGPGTKSGVGEPGEQLTYRITLSNVGSATSAYDHRDILDPNTIYVSDTAGGVLSGAAPGTAGGQVDWTDLTVPAGTSSAPGITTIEIVVQVVDPIPDGVARLINVAFDPTKPQPDCRVIPTPPQCSILPVPEIVAKQKQLISESGVRAGVAEPGETLTYRITLTNTGGAAVDFPVQDVLDPNTTFVSADNGGTLSGATPAGGVVDWTVDIAEHDGTSPGRLELIVAVRVNDPLPAGTVQLRNIVKEPTETVDCTDTPEQCVITPTAPQISKRKELIAESGTALGVAEPGETLTYRITLTNTGGADPAYRLQDVLDINTGFVTASDNGQLMGDHVAWTLAVPAQVGDVPGRRVVEVTVAVDDPLPAGVVRLINIAKTPEEVVDCTVQPTPPNCVITPTRPQIARAKRLVSESGVRTGVAEPGETLTYEITLTNTGGPATNYAVQDVLDSNTTFGTASDAGLHTGGTPAGGTVNWTGLAVPAQAGTTPGTRVLTVSVTVNDPLPAGTLRLINIAKTPEEVVDCSVQPTPPNCVITPTGPQIARSKDIVGESGLVDGLAEPGETLTYQITLTNTGGTAYTNYSLIDDYDANVSVLSAGGGADDGDRLTWTGLTVPAQVGSTPGTLVLAVEVRVADPIPSGVTAIGNVIYRPGETIDCTAQPTPPECVEIPTPGTAVPAKALTGESGLAAGVAEPGETLTYTVTLTNSGTQPALHDLSDNIDDNTAYVAGSAVVSGTAREPVGADPLVWDDILVPAGDSVAVVYQVRVVNPIPAGVTEIRNAATDDCTANPQACVITPTPGTATPSKALTAESGAISGVAEAGETLTYTVTLTNATSATAIYDLTDNIDDNTVYVAGSTQGTANAGEPDQAADPLVWNDIIVPANNSVTVVYRVTVDDPIPSGVAEIRNAATPDCTVNPAACVVTPTPGTVTPSKALTGEDGLAAGVAEPGETLTYTVTLTNGGEGAALYDLTDNIDNNTTYVANSATVAGTAREPVGTDPLAWDDILVPANGTVAVVYQVTVADPISAGVTEIRNAATDDCTANPQACVIIPTPGTATPSKALTGENGLIAGAAEPGEMLTYTVTLTNSGAAAAIYDLSDNIDENTTYVPGSATVGGAAREPVGSDPLVWDDIIVPAGGSVPVVYRVTVADPLPAGTAELRNVATPDCTANPAACVVTPVRYPADLAITKTDGTNTYAPGANTVYTIVVSNNGPSDVQNALVNDALPSGITSGSWTCGNETLGATCGVPSGTGAIVDAPVDLPVNASVTFMFTVSVPFGKSGEMINTATVTSPPESPDPDLSNNTAYDRDVFPLVDDTKQLVRETGGLIPGVAEPGETLTYRVTLDNLDTIAADYDLTDNIDDNTAYVAGSATVDGVLRNPDSAGDPLVWNDIPVPVGDTVVVEYDVIVANPLPAETTQIRNAATSNCAANPDACVTTPTPGTAVPSKQLTGEEGGVIPNVAEPGETLTYTVTLSNGGAVAALYDLTDNIDDNTDYVAGTTSGTANAGEPDQASDPLIWNDIVVPANGSVTVVYKVTVDTALAADVTEIRNAATPDCTVNPAACVVTPTPGTAIPSKQLTGENGLIANVAEPGETLTYTVTLTNSGTAAALYDLTDDIDGNTVYVPGSSTGTANAGEPDQASDPLVWNDIVVPANGFVTVEYQVTVATPIPSGATAIRNAATPDCAANPAACVVTPTPGTATPSKSLTGETGVLPGVAEPGETLTYTVTLANGGDVDALYDLTDNIDDNTAYVPGTTQGTANAGEPDQAADPLVWNDIVVPARVSLTVVYQVTVANPIPAGVTEIRNAATDDCTANPQACVVTPTPGAAVPSKALIAETGSLAGVAEAGETLTYRVTLTNSTGAAALYDLTDNIDNNTTYLANSTRGTAGAGEPDEASDPLVWNDIPVPANGQVTVEYQVTVRDPIPAGVTEIRNAATPDCAIRPEACVVTPTPGTAVPSKALTAEEGGVLPGVAEPGETLTYTVTLANGDGADTLYDLTDNIDDNTAYVAGSTSGTASAGEPDQATDPLVWNDLLVPANSTVTVVYRVTVAEPIPAGVTEIRNAATPDCAIRPEACVVTPTPGTAVPSKALTAEDGGLPGVAEPGETLTYTVTLSNTGTQPALYDLTDNIDDNTAYVANSTSGSANAGEPDQATDPLVWNDLLVPANSTVTVVYRVTVADPIPAGVTEIRNAATPDCVANPNACVETPTPGTATPTKQLTAEEGGAVANVAEPGETLTYTVTLSNTGTQPALYNLTDNIDDNTAYVAGSTSGSANAGEPDQATDPLVWNDLVVPAGGSVTVVYKVTVDDPIPAGVTEIRNAATEDCTANPDACVITPTKPQIAKDKELVGESGTLSGIAEPGETLTYEITLTNTGGPADDFPIQDMLDPNTTYVLADNGGTHTGGSPAGGIVDWAVDVPAAADASTPGTVVLTVEVTVADPLPAGVVQLVNIAKEPTEVVDCTITPMPENCVITPTKPQIAKDKELVGESGTLSGIAEPGETLTYEITLTNTGGPADDFPIQDMLDPNTTYVSADNGGTHTGGSPAGGIVDWAVDVPAAADASTPGTVVLTVEVTVVDPLPAGVVQLVNIAKEPTEVVDCTVTPTPENCVITPTPGSAVPVKNLTAESGLVADVAEPGETLTYTVTLTNSGTAAALYDLTDNIDENITYVAGTAIVDGTAREPDTADDPLVWNDIVVPAGGTVDVVYQLTVVDPIPDGVTEIRNVAYKTGDPEPDCTVTPTPPNCVTVPVPGKVTPAKELSAESGVVADIAEPGETLTYTVTLTNDGAATTYDLADNIDGNTTYLAGTATVAGRAREPDVIGDPLTWNDIVVPAGGTVQVIYQVTVADPLPPGVTEIRNLAYDGSKPEPSCEDVPAQCVVIDAPAPEVTLEKGGVFRDENGNGVAEPGEAILYTFEVRNAGNVPLDEVTPKDAGPTFNGVDGTGRLSGFEPNPVSLDPGQVQAFTATYTLTQADIDNGAGVDDGVENTATAVGMAFSGTVSSQPVESDEAVALLALPAAVSDITVTKVANLRFIRRGEDAPFTIRVRNNAGSAASGLTVVDTIPSGFRFVEGSARIGDTEVAPVIAGRQIRFENVSVAGNAEIEIRLRLTALSSAGPGEHVNLAHVEDASGSRVSAEARAVVEII
ncbi:DUF6923 family protein, partial [Chelativorans sp.]|uniref:DUF7927 domain-containing protein n=1 Tax=Chelativorans sp. TaxID=2203393 RepID=UPI002811781F